MQLVKSYRPVTALVTLAAFVGQIAILPVAAMASGDESSQITPAMTGIKMPPELREYLDAVKPECLKALAENKTGERVYVQIKGQDEKTGEESLPPFDCNYFLEVEVASNQPTDKSKGADCPSCNMAKAAGSAPGVANLEQISEAVKKGATAPAAPAQPVYTCPKDPERDQIERAQIACAAGQTDVMEGAGLSSTLASMFSMSPAHSDIAESCKIAAKGGLSNSDAASSCVKKIAAEAWKGIVGSVVGLAEMVAGLGELIVKGAAKLAKGAWNIAKSLFGFSGAEKMEDSVSEKMQLGAQTPPGMVDQILENPLSAIGNLVAGMSYLATHFVEMQVQAASCTKWDGKPGESQCMAAKSGWECLSQVEKNKAVCEGTGSFLGNFVVGSMALGSVAALGAGMAKRAAPLLAKGMKAAGFAQKAGPAALKAVEKVAAAGRIIGNSSMYKAARFVAKPVVKGTVASVKWTAAKTKALYTMLAKVPVAGMAVKAPVALVRGYMAFDDALFRFGQGGMKAVRLARAEHAIQAANKAREAARTAEEAVSGALSADAAIASRTERLAALKAANASDSAKEIAQVNKEIAEYRASQKALSKLQAKRDTLVAAAKGAEDASLKPVETFLDKQGIATQRVTVDNRVHLQVMSGPNGSPIQAFTEANRAVSMASMPGAEAAATTGRVLIAPHRVVEGGAAVAANNGNYLLDAEKALKMKPAEWLNHVNEGNIATDLHRAGGLEHAVQAQVAERQLARVTDQIDEVDSVIEAAKLESAGTDAAATAARNQRFAIRPGQLVGYDSPDLVPVRQALVRQRDALATEATNAVNRLADANGVKLSRSGNALTVLPGEATPLNRLAKVLDGPKDESLAVTFHGDRSIAGNRIAELEGNEVSLSTQAFAPGSKEEIESLTQRVGQACKK